MYALPKTIVNTKGILTDKLGAVKSVFHNQYSASCSAAHLSDTLPLPNDPSYMMVGETGTTNTT